MLCAIGCEQHHAVEPKGHREPRVLKPHTVQVTTARKYRWPKTVRAQGSLIGDESVVVGAKMSGRVRHVLIDLGTTVRPGQVLAKFETEELDLRVEQAEAQLTQARAAVGLKPGESKDDLDRMKAPPVAQERAQLEQAKASLERAQQLFAKKATTLEDLQEHQSEVKVAEARYASSLNAIEEKIALLAVREAELSLVKQTRDDATIAAPFEGVVHEKHTASGAFLRAGEPVATIVRTHPLRFRGSIPELDALDVARGQTVLIRLEGLSAPLQASITRVSPALDLSSRSLTIEADIPNTDGRLRIGLFAEADIVIDPEAKALAIPESSVVEFAGVEKVLVVRNGEAKEREIRTGRRHDEMIEIVTGLEPGDVVVVEADSSQIGPVAVKPVEGPGGEGEPVPAGSLVTPTGASSAVGE